MTILKDYSLDNSNIESISDESYRAEGTRSSIKKNGSVYTTELLAKYISDKVLEILLQDLKKQPNKSLHLNKFRILDPACGKGELLVNIWDSLKTIAHESENTIIRHDKSCPNDILCGIDVDKNAISQAKKRIGLLPDAKSKTYNFINTNAIYPYKNKNCNTGWSKVKRNFDAKSGFDIVIANPPWGAEVNTYKDEIPKNYYTLFKGQFDTSDLFLESAIYNTKENGYFAFILPDSLFSQERKALRDLILNNTSIKYIGRLGEKFFKGVNRACVILICQKSKPNKNNKVQCMRLTPEMRKKILRGDVNFRDAEKKLTHHVKQSRFFNNKDSLFDIDISIDEESILHKINNSKSNFRSYLSSSRGVELSKTGKVAQCNNCYKWMPLPTNENIKCPYCKINLLNNNLRKAIIISKKKKDGYSPIIVGENIQRYKLINKYWIDTNKDGINYKDITLYSAPKLIVRKTGVGISATIDYENSFTNQVVYIFKVLDNILNIIPLEFFLGVLCSRAIYYYTIMKHGETEWRSHPYVTQKQILDIPLPDINELLNRKRNIVTSITKLVTENANHKHDISPASDAKIEHLVAELFGLSTSDYDSIFSTLHKIESLKPVRALKNINTNFIFSSQ